MSKKKKTNSRAPLNECKYCGKIWWVNALDKTFRLKDRPDNFEQEEKNKQ